MTIRRPWRNAAALLLALILAACASTPRPTPPPAGIAVEKPWGAVPFEAAAAGADKSVSDGLVASLRARFDRARAANETGKIPYRALTLSGGGSRGAYGAGVLRGWTVRGDRPQFDVVTGISTGALMATHAFLGSEFDQALDMYKNLSDEDVFKKRGIIETFKSAAALDTAPLREQLLSVITEETLDLVAAEYRAGRRLFIGTTNLDANQFVIWDMGVIAESDRPDRLQRYIDVVMASAAFPVAFEPVYIEVDGENGTYTQMHADGGIRESAFFFDFIDELYRAVDAAGLSIDDFKQELYLLINGKIASVGPRIYTPVEGSLGGIVDATVTALLTKVTQGSVYRLWVVSMVDGADFHISFVPRDFEFTSGSLAFDSEEQSRLFERGYRQAIEGTAWATQLAPASTEELLKLVMDPTSRFDRQEPPAWMKRGAQ